MKHSYGSVVPVSSRDPTKFQHQVEIEQGYKLMMLKKSLCFNLHP
jgi:histone acetyltransferase (RNA polymerase elongator complex component)